MSAVLYQGDALDVLVTLPERSVRCCMTSPPYWGLRDYGVTGQVGLEATPEEYVAKMVAVFREVRRVLTDDGTLWLNTGDSYCAAPNGNKDANTSTLTTRRDGSRKRDVCRVGHSGNKGNSASALHKAPPRMARIGLKPKDLVGIPWRVAFALQADGWWLRSDIIWAKPNPMPESVTDRPTKAHEYVFLLSKSERYFYDAAAIAEPAISAYDPDNCKAPDGWATYEGGHGSFHRDGREAGRSGNVARKLGADRGRPGSHLGGSVPWEGSTRNARTVWTIATQPYPEAHFATFPEELARRCILAGSAPGDTVLDPFGGSGTVAAVAVGNGRRSVYIELNPAYVELASQRIGPMLCEMAEERKVANGAG